MVENEAQSDRRLKSSNIPHRALPGATVTDIIREKFRIGKLEAASYNSYYPNRLLVIVSVLR